MATMDETSVIIHVYQQKREAMVWDERFLREELWLVGECFFGLIFKQGFGLIIVILALSLLFLCFCGVVFVVKNHFAGFGLGVKFTPNPKFCPNAKRTKHYFIWKTFPHFVHLMLRFSVPLT
jgi:hypothetical protein